jgi:single-stranded DNA-binding protein
MNTITIVGNVGKPVELKFSQGGMAVGTLLLPQLAVRMIRRLRFGIT